MELWVCNLCSIYTDSHQNFPQIEEILSHLRHESTGAFAQDHRQLPKRVLMELTVAVVLRLANASRRPESVTVKLHLPSLHFEKCFPQWRGKAAGLLVWVEELGYLPPFCWSVIVRECRHSATINLHLAASLRTAEEPLSFAFAVFADTRFQTAREEREESHQSQLLPARKKWLTLITPLRPVPEKTYFLYELMPSDLLFYILFIICAAVLSFLRFFVT